MMKRLKLTMLILLLGAHWAYADSAGEALQIKLNAIRTMKADFSQTVKAKQRQLSKSSGTMALARPGRFRWDTESPMAQLVVADGQQLWVYDVELEQVTVKKQEKSIGGTAALFLSGDHDTVTRDFKVTLHKARHKDIFDLKAISNKANFQRVKLMFNNEILRGMELFDQLGQRTIVRFSKIQMNPVLNKAIFTFKPPKDVDVVRQ